MSWLLALVLGFVTGLLGYVSVSYYYSLRYRNRSNVLARHGIDLIALIWILFLAYAPTYVLQFVFGKSEFNERILSFLILIVFMVGGYISFKKSNPEAFQALFGSKND